MALINSKNSITYFLRFNIKILIIEARFIHDFHTIHASIKLYSYTLEQQQTVSPVYRENDCLNQNNSQLFNIFYFR